MIKISAYLNHIQPRNKNRYVASAVVALSVMLLVTSCSKSEPALISVDSTISGMQFKAPASWTWSTKGDLMTGETPPGAVEGIVKFSFEDTPGLSGPTDAYRSLFKKFPFLPARNPSVADRKVDGCTVVVATANDNDMVLTRGPDGKVRVGSSFGNTWSAALTNTRVVFIETYSFAPNRASGAPTPEEDQLRRRISNEMGAILKSIEFRKGAERQCTMEKATK